MKGSRLPLNSAYPFGVEHGLAKEIAEIRDMEVEWDLSYNSTVRRGYIVELFRARGLIDEFVEQAWPVGSTGWGTKEADFCVSIKRRYEDFLEARGADPGAAMPLAEDAEQAMSSDEITFGLERDLQAALRSNIEQLEPGLRIVDEGTERVTVAGRIDITARDSIGNLVVVELKAGTARPAIIAQILAYMASVAEEEPDGVRGIIVAGDFHDRVILAARAIPNLALRQYGFRFTFQAVS